MNMIMMKINMKMVLLAVTLATALAYAFQPLALCPNAVLVGPDNASALLSYISQAQRAVYVEVYVFTWRPLAETLASLAERGVQVYVVLSERVYGVMPTTERQLVQYMQNAGVHVVFNDDFRYVHSKAFVVDNKTVILGSINPTYSGVGSNMGLSVVIINETLAEEIATIILNDYRGVYPRYDFQGVVISPINSYNALSWLLSQPGPAYAAVEVVYNSSGLADLLVNKAALVIARVTDVSWVKTVEDLTAKVIVVGDLVYVGSINLSGSSVFRNREIGLILNCSSFARAAKALVEKWAASSTTTSSTTTSSNTLPLAEKRTTTSVTTSPSTTSPSSSNTLSSPPSSTISSSNFETSTILIIFVLATIAIGLIVSVSLKRRL